ncbi:TRAP transporter permease [Chloroflexota bacterium]
MQQEQAPLAPKYRRPTKVWKLMSVLFPMGSVVLALLYIFHWRPFGLVLIDISYLYLLLAVFLPLVFIWIPVSKKARRDTVPWYDIVLILLAFFIPLYFVYSETRIMFEGWGAMAPPLALALGTIFWLLTIETGRRAAGPIFAVLIIIFSTYPLYAQYMPGILMGPPLKFTHVASYFAFSEEGIVGIPAHIFGLLVFGYMFFAVSIQSVGAGKFFTDLATSLLGTTRAGNAKVAIIASGFFASISGSGISNVFVTGSFTIPAMKREGLSPEFAGGVEASASAGGMLMPPVMSSAAFIMAEFIEVSYAVVCITAAVPSILYYICLFSQIDAYAARLGFKPKPIAAEIPPVWRTLLTNSHIILSFLVLIYVLFYLRLVSWAPWYATAIALVGALFKKDIRSNIRKFITEMFADVGRLLGEIMGILAPVGLIIGAFVITGVAFSFPHAVVRMAGGNIYLMLLLGFAASFILGMGVPLVAVYVFLAIVLVPGLVLGGINILAAHLFVMYCAVMSAITPPVALNAFAAATIAGSDPMKTGFEAMKLGVAKYILPFVFVLSPALVLQGPVNEMLQVIPTALIGIIIISAALEGYLWRVGTLTMTARVLLFIAGLLIALPTLEVGKAILSTDIYGAVLFSVIIILFFLLRWGRSPLAGFIVKPI